MSGSTDLVDALTNAFRRANDGTNHADVGVGVEVGRTEGESASSAETAGWTLSSLHGQESSAELMRIGLMLRGGWLFETLTFSVTSTSNCVMFLVLLGGFVIWK